MTIPGPKTERRIKRLEKDLRELSELFTKNDQALRMKIRDMRIAHTAGVVATEFTLANKLGITMDVVMKMLPPDTSAAIQNEINRRVAACPDTTKAAEIVAAEIFTKEGDNY